LGYILSFVSGAILGLADDFIARKLIKPAPAQRAAIVAFLTGFAFLGLAMNVPQILSLIEKCGLVAILVFASLCDIDKGIIPNGAVLAAIYWWLLYMLVPGGDDFQTFVTNSIGGIIIGAFLLVMTIYIEHKHGGNVLGGGDIKLIFAVSLYLGPIVGLLNLILMCIAGLIYARIIKKEKFPLAPPLACATFVNLLIGDGIVNLYKTVLNTYF